MAAVVRRKEPERVPTTPTKADAHRLRWLADYAAKARQVVADVIAWDEARMEIEEQIVQLDARLADPALADHPKRPAAQRRRDQLERDAVDAGLPRPNLVREFARLAGEMTRLIRDLSPGALAECEGICGSACRSIDPAYDLWRILGFPPEVPTWVVGRAAANVWSWQARNGGNRR